MANTKITSRVLADDAVLTANITDANVTTAKIAADAITGAKIADDAINSEHYTDGSIDTAHIADANVTTAKIADDAITTAKIADDVALGGNPTTTTQTSGNNTTRIATTAFVTTAIAAISTSSAADDISTGDAAVTIGTSSGNITLDSPASIKLNADGGQIAFEDGSTEIGVFENSSSDFQIEAKVQDKDIKFVGNDNGSAVTALTLDMSDAGTAIFNHDIVLGDDDVIKLGDSTGDLELYHIGGSVSVLRSTPALVLQSDDYISLGTYSGGELMLKATKNGAVDLYHDNAIKLSTTSTGVEVPNLLVEDDIGHSGDSNTYMSFENDFLGFYTGGTGTLFMNTGKVAVGSTQVNVTDAILTVDGGDMMVHGANNSAGVSDLLSGYTRGDYGVFYSTANTIYFRIGSSYVSYIASNGTYNVSDERLKENVATLTGTLDKVKQLRGVSHTWKDTEEKGTDTVIGMIAQEVETVYPELVGDGGLPNDNAGNAPYKSINYAHLTSVLVEAVKELSTKLEAAEARIKTLEDA